MPERPVVVEVKSASVPPFGEVRYTWWATVDRHPFSDQRGYGDRNTATTAATRWVNTHYPGREISYLP